MAETDTPSKGVAIINIFTIPPERNADELITLLRTVTEQVMRHQPGFRSATLYVSKDGERVTNVAQWDSEEAFRAVLQNPEARAHMQHTQEFQRDARFYTLVETFRAEDTQ